jgi:hypothetical protein
MKSESEIKGKLKEIKYRYVKKQIKQNRKHIPQNCFFNSDLKSDRSPDFVLGVCTHEETDEWVSFYGKNDHRVCDLNFEGQSRCKECPFFKWKYEKDDIKEGIDTELLNLSAAKLAFNYPELMTLLWVLDDDDSRTDDPSIIKDYENPIDLQDDLVSPEGDLESPQEDTLVSDAENQFYTNLLTKIHFYSFIPKAYYEDNQLLILIGLVTSLLITGIWFLSYILVSIFL